MRSHPTFVDGEVRLIGQRWSPRVHELKQFLARSRVPYRWLDVERDAVHFIHRYCSDMTGSAVTKPA